MSSLPSDLNDWTNDRQGSKPVKTKSANLYVNEMIKHGWDLEDLEGQRKKILNDPWLTDRERDAWESFFDNVEDGYKDYRAQVKKGTQKKGQPYDPSATFNTNDNDPD